MIQPERIDTPTSSHLTNFDPSRIKDTFPYYSLLKDHPLKPLESQRNNLLFRLAIRDECSKSEKWRKAVWQACRDDYLFFLAVFCFLYEPRGDTKIERKIPFIPWPHQEDVYCTMVQCWNKEDLIWDKGRGEGATWGAGMKLLHSWLFDEMWSGAIVSANKKLADTKGDIAGSFMPKLDWQIGNLPDWMVPRYRRVSGREDSNLQNLDRENSVTAWPATENVGTSGRFSTWVWDEMAKFPKGTDTAALASTEPTTKCRMMISTYAGTNNEYYKLMRNPGNIKVVTLRWQDNPSRNRQIFRLRNGTPWELNPEDRLDKDFKDKWPSIKEKLYLRGFDFHEDHDLSPWYIERCLRGMSPKLMAQEYDRNPELTEDKYFSIQLRDTMVRTTVRQNYVRGQLVYEEGEFKPRFEFSSTGPLLLWVPVVNDKPVFSGKYGVGCDISHGLGGDRSSNSASVGFDLQTGEQVLEFATTTMSPEAFARWNIALCTLLGGAVLNWEALGGVGSQFSKVVLEDGYGNIYTEKQLGKIKRKRTDKVGWTQSDKRVAFGRMKDAIIENRCKIRSQAIVSEMSAYIFNDTGNLVHAEEEKSEDRFSRGKGHGDRVVAASMAWVLVDEKVVSVQNPTLVSPKIPGTLAYRMLGWGGTNTDPERWHE